MGLFGKKKSEEVRIIFYEGDLPGFRADVVCLLSLQDDVLLISSFDGKSIAKLPADRILDIEMLGEPQFLEKYKGSTMVKKSNEIPREFYVLHFIGKDGNEKQIVFWGVNKFFKVQSLKDKLPMKVRTSEYEL